MQLTQDPSLFEYRPTGPLTNRGVVRFVRGFSSDRLARGVISRPFVTATIVQRTQT